MIVFKNVAAALAVGLVVAAAASPALAASAKKRTNAHPGYAARAQAIGNGGSARASDRESILRECNGKVEGMRQNTWGVQQGSVYRSCMAERGQVE